MKQKFRVVLEVEVDPKEYTGEVRNGNPGDWNWRAIGRLVEIPNLEISTVDSFIACCENKIEWQTDKPSYPFEVHDHNKDCINYVPFEEYLEHEGDYDDLAFAPAWNGAW